ncbi:MAG: acyloxyacyl hydrolase [Segetibacter sp.]|nr:acyloxyacyl hydrolase [Segetibacter sp.]
MCRLLLMMIVTLIQSALFAQQDTTTFYKGIQARLHYGFIFAHSTAVQNTAGAHPRGVELETIRQRIDTTVWNICHCYPIKGWSFSYFDFNNRVLGRGLTGAYLLEPTYRIGSKGQFRFRGNVGLSYLTNPYHPQTNPTNMSYSSLVSGFLRLGVSVSYRFTPKWLLQLGAQYQHVSNGGWKEPNKGINWPTASVGVTYYNKPFQLPVYKQLIYKSALQKKPYFEAGLLLAAKQGYQAGGRRARTPLIGLLIQAEKQVGRTNAIITGLEFYYDNALKQQLQKDSVSGSAWRAGLSAGHDFLLGKFFFSQHIGVYLFNQTPYYNRVYHRWILRYQLNKYWLAGFGLKAHKQVAEVIDLRILYRFKVT